MSDLPERLSLREVGPRDGLQNEAPVPTDGQGGADRRAVARPASAHRGGVVRAPEGDPADGRRRRGVGRASRRNPDVRYSALVPNLRGRASARWTPASPRSRSSSRRRTRTTARTSTAPPRSRSTTSPRSSTSRTAAGATVQVIVSTAWGCPYEGEVPVERVLSVAGRALARRRRRACRTATRPAWRRRPGSPGWSARPARRYPDAALNLHFHNTRGTGLANVLAALELGVSDFDASVGGLGGCPYAPGATGNIATEELVHMVEDMGVATGVDLEAMIDAAARGRAHRRPDAALAGAARRPAHPHVPDGTNRPSRTGGFCVTLTQCEEVSAVAEDAGPVRRGGATGDAVMPRGCAPCSRSPRSSGRPAGSRTSSSSPPRRPAARWTRRRCRSRAGTASRARCGRWSTSGLLGPHESPVPRPTRSIPVSAWPDRAAPGRAPRGLTSARRTTRVRRPS